jgi:hypothetical protein
MDADLCAGRVFPVEFVGLSVSEDMLQEVAEEEEEEEHK